MNAASQQRDSSTEPVPETAVLASYPPHERLELPPAPRFPRAPRVPVILVLVAVPVSAAQSPFVRYWPARTIDVTGETVSDRRVA